MNRKLKARDPKPAPTVKDLAEVVEHAMAKLQQSVSVFPDGFIRDIAIVVAGSTVNSSTLVLHTSQTGALDDILDAVVPNMLQALDTAAQQPATATATATTATAIATTATAIAATANATTTTATATATAATANATTTAATANATATAATATPPANPAAPADTLVVARQTALGVLKKPEELCKGDLLTFEAYKHNKDDHGGMVLNAWVRYLVYGPNGKGRLNNLATNDELRAEFISKVGCPAGVELPRRNMGKLWRTWWQDHEEYRRSVFEKFVARVLEDVRTARERQSGDQPGPQPMSPDQGHNQDDVVRRVDLMQSSDDEVHDEAHAMDEPPDDAGGEGEDGGRSPKRQRTDDTAAAGESAPPASAEARLAESASTALNRLLHGGPAAQLRLLSVSGLAGPALQVRCLPPCCLCCLLG
jgi:hypothetical protein